MDMPVAWRGLDDRYWWTHDCIGGATRSVLLPWPDYHDESGQLVPSPTCDICRVKPRFIPVIDRPA